MPDYLRRQLERLGKGQRDTRAWARRILADHQAGKRVHRYPLECAHEVVSMGRRMPDPDHESIAERAAIQAE